MQFDLLTRAGPSSVVYRRPWVARARAFEKYKTVVTNVQRIAVVEWLRVAQGGSVSDSSGTYGLAILKRCSPVESAQQNKLDTDEIV